MRLTIWKIVYVGQFILDGTTPIASIDHPNDFATRAAGRKYMKENFSYWELRRCYKLVKFEGRTK